MDSDNIFTGLKVVDFASFIAGPSAAVILARSSSRTMTTEPGAMPVALHPGGVMSGHPVVAKTTSHANETS